MRITLAENDMHLWYAWDQRITDAALLARYRQLLTADERERQDRFHFARHRHQYLVSRALLRGVLSRYAAVEPGAWRFRNNAFGKPEIANAGIAAPRFNLSHSEQLVVLAVAARGEVGVDVEWLGRSASLLELADHYFAPEEVRQLRALPAAMQTSRFFDFWTLKEAYIKACGLGLSIPLHHFSFRFDASGRVGIAFHPERGDDAGRWQFWQVSVSDQHRLALAQRLPARVPQRLTVRQVVPLADQIEVAAPFVHSLP